MPQDKKISRKKIAKGNLEHFRYFEKMDQVNRALQGTIDLEQVMKDVLDALLSVFECDRAWLVYPCDPEATTWQTPMERTRSEYPGVLPIGIELPLDPVGRDVFRILRNTEGSVKFGPGCEYLVPAVMEEAFRVQSFIATALYPKVGKPWSFGLHQCSYARVWSSEEEQLFQEVGRRLSDTLTSLLAYRNLQVSEAQVKQLIDTSPLAMLVSSGNDQKVELINDKFIELFGYTLEDMPDVEHWWPLAYPDEKYREEIRAKWQAQIEKAITNKSQTKPMEVIVFCKDCSRRYIEVCFSSIGERHLITFTDLTERKRMEEEISASEAELRTLIHSMTDIVFVSSAEGRFLKIVDTSPPLLYKPPKEMLGKTLHEAFPLDLADFFLSQLREALATQKSVNFEYSILIEDTVMWFYATVSPMPGDQTLMVARDITERKRNERELIILNRAINQSSDAVFLIDEQLTFAYVNDAACRSLGYTREELLTMGPPDIDAVVTYDMAKDFLNKLFTNGSFPRLESQHKTRDGRIFPVEISFSMVEYGGMNFSLTTVQDITERKRAEENLRMSEEKYRALAENIPNVVYQCKNDSRYTFIYLNNAIEKLTGYSKSDFLENGLSFFDLYHSDDVKKIPTPQDNNVMGINRKPFHVTYRIRHKSGKWRWVDEWGTGITDSNGKVEYLEGIMVDITERKQHEREREAIISVSTALRQAGTKTGILNIILDQLVKLFEVDGAVLVLPNVKNGGFIDEMGRGVVGERMKGLIIPTGMGVCNWVITNETPYLNNRADQDPLFYRPDLLGDSHCVACAPLLAQERTIGALWMARQIEFTEQDLRLLNAIADIAANAIHRVMLHEQTELQLHHLIALHQIDIAISSNYDSNLTLNVILHNVKNELEVDAANILLLDPITHTLDFVAGLGFRTRGIEQSHVRLVDGYAGTAAREYRTVSCLNLKLVRDSFSRSSLLADEEFAAHFATPLVVKGQVKGVLELFHRKAFEPESDWLDYFETLATQAAIAIESASLLENLQRSNAELILAYDATIEGWSRALDLRDKETEGHTQRVTEMALELAEKMGLNELEKKHLWRGSLLHDIGKMGVPDSILLKPGPLSEEEKEIMRQHPLYAYTMLSPIKYLKSAMDISYCHHEKWDGSGYPRGLKGEEIPISARMFAVVDVFDALISDRPYRKAWPREDVYRYIQEQAGKHFDPQIVKIVLENRMW